MKYVRCIEPTNGIVLSSNIRYTVLREKYYSIGFEKPKEVCFF